MKILKLTISFLFIIVFFSSCLVVKEGDDDSEPYVNIKLSPVPEILMSDNIVRSARGDMIAFIPKGWFFVDLEDKASSEIIAVAVNPEYTFNAVFSVIRKNERLDSAFATEGLYGLARQSFARRERKTAGAVKLIGKFEHIEMGLHEFVKYRFTSTGGAAVSQAVVFQSELNNYYEFALLQMDVKGITTPTQEETDKIFRSITATIKFN